MQAAAQMALEIDDQGDEPERPRTRADCIDGPRPCPWVSCRYHLLVDVKPNGGIALNITRPGEKSAHTISRHTRHHDRLEDIAVERLEAMSETCALDVAEAGGASFARVGRLMGLTKQGVLAIQKRAHAKCKSSK